MFRLIRATYNGVKTGTWVSLAIGLFCLIMVSVVFTIWMLPVLQSDSDDPRRISSSELRELEIFSPFEFVELRGELTASDVRSDNFYYGILEVGSRLLLVESQEPLKDTDDTFIGTLQTRDPEYINLQDRVADDVNISGTFASAYFRLGERDQLQYNISWFLLGVLSLVGLAGIGQFIRRRLGLITD